MALDLWSGAGAGRGVGFRLVWERGRRRPRFSFGKLAECSDRNICEICSNWNTLCVQECAYPDVCTHCFKWHGLLGLGGAEGGNPNAERGWHSTAGSANYMELRDMGSVPSVPGLVFRFSVRPRFSVPV